MRRPRSATEDLLRVASASAAGLGVVYAVNGLTRKDAHPTVTLTDAAYPPLADHHVESLGGPLAEVWVSDLTRVESSVARIGLWGTLLLVAGFVALLALHAGHADRRAAGRLVAPGPYLQAAAVAAVVVAVAQPLLQRLGGEVVLAAIGSPPGYVPHGTVAWFWPALAALLLLGTRIPLRPRRAHLPLTRAT